MKKHRTPKEPEPDSAELTRMSFDLLVRLAQAVATNEKTQHKFRNCVLIRLSKIETMLTEVLGCQLAQYWPEGKVSDKIRTNYLQEVEGRTSMASEKLGLKMIQYIYGEAEMPESRHDRRQKWWGWEI